MPAEVIGSATPPSRPETQETTSPSGGQTTPPSTPQSNPTEDRIKEILAEIEALQQEIERIKQQRETAYRESSSQILLAEALRNSEEAQRDDSPPVDEFDQSTNSGPQAYSMSEALRFRTISTLRDLVYGNSLGEIRNMNEQVTQLQQELRDLREPAQPAQPVPTA